MFLSEIFNCHLTSVRGRCLAFDGGFLGCFQENHRPKSGRWFNCNPQAVFTTEADSMPTDCEDWGELRQRHPFHRRVEDCGIKQWATDFLKASSPLF